jgi:hypothetical protein
MSNKEIKKVPVYLFSEECPQGEAFSFYDGKESDEYKEMLENGYVDTPAKLDLPVNLDTGINAEDAKNLKPQDLVAMVESIGFYVATPEQMKAEAVKMAQIALDIANFSDADIIAEAVKRGLKEPSPEDLAEDAEIVEIEEEEPIEITLATAFRENPEALIEESLIMYGEEIGLTLKSNWKKETMIKKINEKLEEA